MKVAPIEIRTVNKGLVQSLENMLKDAKSGEITGLLWVVQTQGNYVESGWSGILGTRSRTVVGEIEFLKQSFIDAAME